MLRQPPEQGSLRFLAERRVGKTTIITKMAAEPWEMEHFRTRLETYYQRAVQDVNGKTLSEDAIARTILDHFATVDTPQSIDEVWSMIRNQFALMDRNLIVQMLKHLAQDHYLISDTDKRYSFRFPLVKRWWKIAQGLQS